MQAVMVVPSGSEKLLTEDVASVPLLARVVATAKRAGVTQLLLLWPGNLDFAIWEKIDASRFSDGVETLRFRNFQFDPRKSSGWAAIFALLEEQFLWLPWNFVTSNRILAAIRPSPVLPLSWKKPVYITKELLFGSPRAGVTTDSGVDGVTIDSHEDISPAERFLVRNSGKATDGIYFNFNRKLSRPAVRALTHTPITPNMVTLVGLVVAIVSAVVYSRGTYLSYVLGAVLFFVSGLVDEMDGMLARLKFSESAFGTWFEGFVDNVTYLLLFGGITAGLYRQYGKSELIWGVALIGGAALSAAVVAVQRKALTAPNRPQEYASRINRLMETDSNWISRIVRQIHIFIKKGVAVHYVLIFTVLGGLSLFLRVAAISANLTWILAFYFTWKFTRRNRAAALAI